MSAPLTTPDEPWQVWGEAIPVDHRDRGQIVWEATVRQGQVAVCIVGGATKEIAEKNAFVVAAAWELYSELLEIRDRYGLVGRSHALRKANP